MRTVTALALTLLSCSSKSAPAPEAPGSGRYATESTEPDYSPPADCAAALQKIRAAVASLEPPIREQPAIFAPVVERAETPGEPGAVVTLRGKTIQLDNVPVDLAKLNQRLRARVRYGAPLYIYAEGRARASEILAIANAAPRGAESHLVVMRRRAPFPWDRVRPEPSAGWANKMFDALRAAGDGDREALEKTLMTTALGSCKAALDVFEPVAGEPSSREARRLGPEILAAVDGCGCSGVEMAGLALAVPYMMSRWNKLGTVPLARTRTMRLAPSATATNLALMLMPPTR